MCQFQSRGICFCHGSFLLIFLSPLYSILPVLVVNLRKDTRNLCLRNNTLLPAAWRLSGLEVLGDEFSVSQDQGIILPHSEFCLQMHFRAMKPINLKRAIRLEVQYWVIINLMIGIIMLHYSCLSHIVVV